MRFLIPIVVCVALFGLLAVGLHHDPRTIPSPLIGKPAPAFDLKRLDGQGDLTLADLKGNGVHLVNFWASWCVPCLSEHPMLLKLATEQGVKIVGINYKDTKADAEQWLSRHGDPFAVIAQDPQGQAGLDWGVYGVPETYVVSASGEILFKQVGPITPEVWQQQMLPLLQSTGASATPAGAPS